LDRGGGGRTVGAVLTVAVEAEAALGGPGAPAVHAAAAQPGLCLEACHVGTVAGYGRSYGRAALP